MERIIRFTKDVDPDSETTIPWKVPADGMLKSIYTKFYGSKKLLQVRPMIEKFGLEIGADIIKYVGDDEYLSGDFEEVDENIGLKIRRGDVLLVHVKNTDPSIIHSLNLNMVVDL